MLSDWMMDWNQVIMCKCIACNSHECHVPCRAVLCSIHLIILFTFTFTFISWRSKTSRCVHAYEGLCCTSVCNTAKYLNLILKQFVGNSLIKIRFTTSPTIYVVSFIIHYYLCCGCCCSLNVCVRTCMCALNVFSHVHTMHGVHMKKKVSQECQNHITCTSTCVRTHSFASLFGLVDYKIIELNK